MIKQAQRSAGVDNYRCVEWFDFSNHGAIPPVNFYKRGLRLSYLPIKC
jgi:hypothetical protein